MKPELLKNGSTPAIWQDSEILPLYRWTIKKVFKLRPFDYVLVSILIVSILTLLTK